MTSMEWTIQKVICDKGQANLITIHLHINLKQKICQNLQIQFTKTHKKNILMCNDSLTHTIILELHGILTNHERKNSHRLHCTVHWTMNHCYVQGFSFLNCYVRVMCDWSVSKLWQLRVWTMQSPIDHWQSRGSAAWAGSNLHLKPMLWQITFFL
jgi:hypothetical protein